MQSKGGERLVTNHGGGWINVVLAGHWFPAWCQGLCHLCCDPGLLVLNGNGSPLRVKYLSISVYPEQCYMRGMAYNSRVKPPLLICVSLELCDVEFLHSSN